MKKLNFGSNRKKQDGYINVDALPDVGADLVWNLVKIPYPKELEEADEINAIEFLEHISFREVLPMLKEWRRILKFGGKIFIQVPDCGKMMEYYMDKKICECVPHKPIDVEDAKADPNCWKCNGNAMVNPKRWLFAFTGAQKHEYDIHRNIFTKESLRTLLETAGFINIKIGGDKYGWKLVATANK